VGVHRKRFASTRRDARQPSELNMEDDRVDEPFPGSPFVGAARGEDSSFSPEISASKKGLAKFQIRHVRAL
jgi:hypothetical protein